MSSVPILRFKEFTGEWEEKLLGKIAIFSKGKGISKADIVENGGTECIRYGELYTQYNELIQNVISKTNINKKDLVLSEYGDIIIPASGETQIDIATASCLLKDNIALGGDLNIIKTKEDGVFLSYYLNNAKKFNIARLSQGVSVVHLYSSQLKTLELNLPTKQEQEKIASFLTSVDTKIEQLTKKESLLQEYKKGVMQKIFNQEIRFRADDGSEFEEWEEKKLGSLGTFFSGGTPTSSNKSFYSGSIPFIGSGKINSKEVDQFITEKALNSSSAKMVEIGDLLYALYGATSGEVAISKINGAINQAVLCIRSNNNKVFLKTWLEINKEKILKTYLQGGQGNLSAQIVKSLRLKIPSLEEQSKIANFISSINTKIEQVQKQLNSTKEFKKALLQQMFV
jgi:type I restriction enzyme S subunit